MYKEYLCRNVCFSFDGRNLNFSAAKKQQFFLNQSELGFLIQLCTVQKFVRTSKLKQVVIN